LEFQTEPSEVTTSVPRIWNIGARELRLANNEFEYGFPISKPLDEHHSDRNRGAGVAYEQHKVPCSNMSIQEQDEIGDGHSCSESPCFDSQADCAMNHLIRLVAEHILRATAKELMRNLHQYFEHRRHVITDTPEQQ